MVLLAVLFFSIVSSVMAQSKVSLESENMFVWNRMSTDGRVKLYSTVTESDTTFFLGFELRDTKSLIRIEADDELTVFFDNGDTLALACNAGSRVMDGREDYFYMMSYVPLVSSLSFKDVTPFYKVSREQLLKVATGRVVNLTFHAGEDIYTVDIKSNRFSECIAEECANLRVPKNRRMPNAKGTDITTEMLFGTTKLRRPAFHWNRTLGMSLGYNQFYDAFCDDVHGQSAKGMVSLDFFLKGFYWGMSINGKDSRFDSDYRIMAGTFKVGPAFMYGTYRSWFTFAPYAGLAFCELHHGEKSQNMNKEFLVGVRTSYNISHFEFGVNCSNREAGCFIGFSM